MGRAPELPLDDLEASLIRILSPSGKAWGTGFLVDENKVFTCAHVVAKALGVDATTDEAPEGKLIIEFSRCENKASVTAAVSRWLPVIEPPDQRPQDVAILEFTETVPPEARPARVVADSFDTRNVNFEAFGFSSDPGDSFRGTIRVTNTDGWAELESEEVGRDFVEHGCSGAAVWDDEHRFVLGMVVWKTNDQRASMLPTRFLRVAWPDLPDISTELPAATASGILQTNIYERPPVVSPANLLNARYCYVPFLEEIRAAEIARLTEWCDHAIAASACLFTGLGGSGKTRLFIEWAERLRGEGWEAGFLPDDASDEELERLANSSRLPFVVVDYAEARPTLFEQLEILRRGSATKLRIALLAREASDWWRSLVARSDEVRHLLTSFGDPIPVSRIAVNGDHRGRVFSEACNAFACELRKDVPSTSPALHEERFGSVLYVQMAALAAVERLGDLRSAGLLGSIVEHETRIWSKDLDQELARRSRHGRIAFPGEASRLVAALTLRGGAADREALQALRGASSGPGEDEFIDLIESMYPGQADGAYVGGLEPDILGEQLVAVVLADPRTPADFLDRAFEGAGAKAVQQALLVLGRLSGHDGRAELAVRYIKRILAADVIERAIPAFDAALALGGETAMAPVGRVLANALEAEGTATIASLIESRVPWETVSLREVGAWATNTLLRAYDSATEDPEVLTKRVILANRLSKRLGELGKWKEAATSSGEAVGIQRKLAATRRDKPMAGLATYLNTYAVDLNHLGRLEEGLTAIEEALEIFRGLAAERPDAFLLFLGNCLTNLSITLLDLGRGEEGLTAIEEAVEIYRKLAAERSDAFLADVGRSLSNLSNVLAGLGRPEDALAAIEESVRIRRKLAAERPDSFLPELGRGLSNLSNALTRLDRREDALAAIEEAVEILRKLAAEQSVAFLSDLATTLINLGSLLSEVGRADESLAVHLESVEILRELAKKQPEAYLPDLADSLCSVATEFLAHERREEAMAAARESLDIRVPIAERFPQVFGDYATRSFRVLVRALHANGIDPADDEQAARLGERLDRLK